MATSLKTWSSYTNDSDEPLGVADKSYFRARTRNHVHGTVLKRFMELSEAGAISRAKLADRLGVGRAVVTRWLSSPGNWTLDTLSDLLLAMNCEAVIRSQELTDVANGNFLHPLSTQGQKRTSVSTVNEERSGVVINMDKHTEKPRTTAATGSL